MDQALTPTQAQANSFALAIATIEWLCREPSLRVSEVAGALFMSRRSLERTFAVHGTSVSNEIRAARVAWATDVLCIAPGFELSSLARRVGFESQTRMGEAFRAVLGETPSSFRRRLRPSASNGDRRPMRYDMRATRIPDPYFADVIAVARSRQSFVERATVLIENWRFPKLERSDSLRPTASDGGARRA
jgi:AraC-like DNA-binding protein